MTRNGIDMAIGIIAEYNPFHNGHAYQVKEIRRRFSDADIVAVMSGSFTQRGTPAILDKWTRARAAIVGGVDLVLELPFVTSVRSAQDFARGGIRLLNELKIIDRLAFGAETEDLSTLRAAAKSFSSKSFSENLQSELSTGISYAAAVTRVLSKFTGADEKFLRQPNNILAIEYLRALPNSIEPILIPRRGADYDDLTLQGKFSSAAAIRAAVYEQSPSWEKIESAVDEKLLDELKFEKINGLVREDFLFRPIITKLLTSSLDDLRKIFGMSEGLEFRLIESARIAKNFDELVKGIVSKRYQTSRIKRLLIHFLIGLTADKIFSANYARVLAFNERGRVLLRRIKNFSELPIITKVTKHLNSRDILSGRLIEPYKKNLAFDLLAADLRETLYNFPRPTGRDFVENFH